MLFRSSHPVKASRSKGLVKAALNAKTPAPKAAPRRLAAKGLKAAAKKRAPAETSARSKPAATARSVKKSKG